MQRSFMIIAGEASGDILGAELVKALRAEAGGDNFQFFGAGGPKLAAAGAELALDLAAHAVVGIVEVLKNYSKFKGFFDDLLEFAFRRRPEFVVLIDYPGFNLRFARALKERVRKSPDQGWQPKVVYYVSPQIWAWHESRIEQIARDIDLMLAIFPFEKGWYAARKPEFKVEFVGHPLIDRYAKERQHLKVEPSGSLLLLLPGSRVREIKKHLPVMIEAACRLATEQPVKVTMVLPNTNLETLARSFADLNGIEVQVGELASALSSATVAIAASGTVTMECAYFGAPTVVIYRTSWSTYMLGRRFIRVKYLAMPNLLADEEIYPELIQDEATAENIYLATKDLLNNAPRRDVIKTKLQRVIASLGEPGASHRAARAILTL